MSTKDVYSERNQLVLTCAALLARQGIKVGWVDDREDRNYVILLMDLPTGQVSWHISRSEINVRDWPRYAGHWDLHTTVVKHGRLIRFLKRMLNEGIHDAAITV